MFADAIQTVGNFTRPIQYITKTYKNPSILTGSNTLFFVNDNGVAVTSKHVAQDLIARQDVEPNYATFKSRIAATESAKNRKVAIRHLETEFLYGPGTATHAKTRFIDCFDTITSMTFHLHPTYDLAIIEFEYQGPKRYEGHATFAKDREYILPGDFLCRLGFPFSEFTDYAYDEANDELMWVPSGPVAAPRFPIDGMVTRFLADGTQVFGIEMSTPGFLGQSGGPLFDEDAVVCGMQFATNHLYLGFDVEDFTVFDRGKEKKVSNQPFLHVGQCIDAEVIKAFLTEHNIEFFTA